MKHFFIFLILISIPGRTGAAELSFDLSEVMPGKPVTVAVMLDTESESINSAEVALSIPQGLVLSGYTQTNSVLPVWIDKPHVAPDGTVVFSGIIPGGIDRVYDPEDPKKRAVTLVSLDFVPTQAVIEGEFRIVRSMVLKNDGKGTSIATRSISQPIRFTTTASANSYQTSELVAPESFTIRIIERAFFARTPRLALFETTDTGSGVKEYRVKKGFGRYVVATSPFALPPALWGFTLTVQAVDYEENVRESTVFVPGNRYLLGVMIGGVLFGGYLFYTYRRRRTTHV